MRTRRSGRALSICVGVLLLAACGGRAVNTVPPVGGAGKSLPYHKTFYYTGRPQSFTVPAGVRKLTVIAVGARGGGYDKQQASLGGRVWAIIPVTADEQLAVYVGGSPGSSSEGGFDGGGKGGFGGGGAGGVTLLGLRGFGGGGGGGSSYIEPSAYAYHSWQGWKLKTTNGLVVFDW